MSDLAIEVAAVLDEFAARQRELGLNEAKLQKITAQRSIGQACTMVCEMTLPQGADAQEIYEALAPWDSAIDRIKAKSDLTDHYFRMLNAAGEIEVAIIKMAHDQTAFAAQNERRNTNRRVAVAYTSQQATTLANQRTSINALFDRIAETKKAVAECRRVLGGEDPFEVLDDQITERLDRLRGSMIQPEAA